MWVAAKTGRRRASAPRSVREHAVKYWFIERSGLSVSGHC
jgi:hypothetical protein